MTASTRTVGGSITTKLCNQPDKHNQTARGNEPEPRDAPKTCPASTAPCTLRLSVRTPGSNTRVCRPRSNQINEECCDACGGEQQPCQPVTFAQAVNTATTKARRSQALLPQMRLNFDFTTKLVLNAVLSEVLLVHDLAEQRSARRTQFKLGCAAVSPQFNSAHSVSAPLGPQYICVPSLLRGKRCLRRGKQRAPREIRVNGEGPERRFTGSRTKSALPKSPSDVKVR